MVQSTHYYKIKYEDVNDYCKYNSEGWENSWTSSSASPTPLSPSELQTGFDYRNWL